MEPEPASPLDLYIFDTTVEEVLTITPTGQTYIKLVEVATRFWVTNPVTLKPGNKVKLMFHKDES